MTEKVQAPTPQEFSNTFDNVDSAKALLLRNRISEDELFVAKARGLKNAQYPHGRPYDALFLGPFLEAPVQLTYEVQFGAIWKTLLRVEAIDLLRDRGVF